jgi:hypothetical protein
MKLKIKLNAYLARFKQSKFLVFALGMTIGISYTYLYIAGSEYYDWAKIGYEYSHEFLDSKEAEASGNNQDMDIVGLPEKPSVQKAENGYATVIHLDNVADKGEALVSPEALIEKYDWDINIAQAVMRAESSGNEKAIGDTHLSKPSIGLFQISQIYHNYPTEQLMNPEENVRIAYEIYKKGGWGRWTTYREGHHIKYLK